MNDLTRLTYEDHTAENSHPGFSVDCVIIAFHKGKIKVLLRDFGIDNYKALLGGFVFNDESADQAAHRILELYTGLNNIFLKQFALFSDPKRTIMKQNLDYVAQYSSVRNDGKWLLRRFITMGYFALVKYDEVNDFVSEKKQLHWYDINKLPVMYSDHELIIKKAQETIKLLMPIIPVGYELLPEKFMMTELRKIHEIFLNKKLDRRNFQRKILQEGFVIQLDERKKGKEYNAPILYSFISPDIKDTM